MTINDTRINQRFLGSYVLTMSTRDITTPVSGVNFTDLSLSDKVPNGSNSNVGIITSGSNKVQIVTRVSSGLVGTKIRIDNSLLFGRITNIATNMFRVHYYTANSSGAEALYNFSDGMASTNITIGFYEVVRPENKSYSNIDWDVDGTITVDSASHNTPRTEIITISTMNTITLSTIPSNGTPISVYTTSGLCFSNAFVSNTRFRPYTVSGNVINWSFTPNPLDVGKVVAVKYFA